ncbi:MAG TPA: hypothetical protein ENG70_03900 [Candidatus Cloacimonetes bacterium]|nr:hypothetical protein [Candidatus Cloacimonadota bacterium]HEX37986.1 hypothetical protein [Candidatus Cloacimonadota bacterium]
MNEQLSIGNIISNGFSYGFKNILNLLGAIILWLVTIWIPYLNIGTTIGLVGLIVHMSKGKPFSPTVIFDAKYRKNFGEFFLLYGFMAIGIYFASILMLIPGIVLQVAWSQALYLFLDKDVKPLSALRKSNELTYGKKWNIFLGIFILMVIVGIIFAILVAIFNAIWSFLGGLFTFIGIIIIIAIGMGVNAYIYSVLSKEFEAEKEPTPLEV